MRRRWLWWALLTILAWRVLPLKNGFFWDDWTPLLVYHLPQPTWKTYVAAFWKNRPGSGLLFAALFPVLGAQPGRWDLAFTLVRVATAVALMAWLRALWPNRHRFYVATALLFLLYPAFTEHAIRIAFTPHWLAYALYLISWWTSARAWRSQRLSWWGWSALTLALSVALVEYYLPLELVRALWFAALVRAEPRDTRRLRWLIPLWALLVIALVAYVHLFSRPFGGEGISPWQRAPWHSITKSVYSVLYPVLFAWVQEWPNIELWAHPRQLWSALRLAGFAVIIGYLLLRKGGALQPSHTQPKTARGLAWGWLPAVALVALVVGMAPFLAVGRFVGFGLYTGRYTLPTLWAAASLWAWFLETGLHRRARTGALLVLLALAGFIQGRAQSTFEASWQRQTAVYAQLRWRLPDVPAHTAWLVDGALAPYVAHYSLSEALNVLYAANIPSNTELAYWAYEVSRPPNEPFPWETQYKIWHVRSGRPLVVAYKQVARGACVWVLDAHHANENPYLSSAQRAWARQAPPPPAAEEGPPWPVFLKADPVQWCAYYEQAERARQRRDWEAIQTLWQQVLRHDLRPELPFEYSPFIEAYAQTQRWDQALALTRRAWHAAREGDEDETRFALCRLWQRLLVETGHPTAGEQAYEEVDALVHCAQDRP